MAQGSFTVLSDHQWDLIQETLDKIPMPKIRGTLRADFRTVWNSILFILVRSARWKELPISPCYASKSAAHRWLRYFQQTGVFHTILLKLLKMADFRGLIDWNQLSVDGSFSPCTRRRGGRELRPQR